MILFLILSSAPCEVRVTTLANEVYYGIFSGIVRKPQLAIVMHIKQKTKQIDCFEIVEIVFSEFSKPSDLPSIVLYNNTKIYGEIVGSTPRYLNVQSPSLGYLAIELTQIKEIRFNDSLREVHADPENDILYFSNGDVMSCLIDNFGKGYIEVQHSQLGKRKEYLDKLERITLAQLDPDLHTSPRLTAIVMGSDNSKISGDIIEVQNENLVLQANYLENPVAIPFRNLNRLFFTNGRFVYLSDLPRQQYKIQYIPYFPSPSTPFLAKFDTNQRGNPLKLSKKIFYKGIGVISRSRIQINLQKKYRKFQSYIGIDDEITQNFQQNPYLIGGSVIFRVFVDGAKKFDSGTMRWYDTPKNLEVEVVNRQVLTLVVDFADHANVNDLANWAGARLIK